MHPTRQFSKSQVIVAGGYYAIFSIAPLLVISIHIASLFLDRTAVVEMTTELTGVIGPSGSDAISQMLNAAGTGRPEGWTGACRYRRPAVRRHRFVGSLQDALDKIWDAPPRPGGIWSFITRALRRDAPGAVVRRGS